MNWYEIFYWVTVADGAKDFFDTFSNVFTWGFIISTVIMIILIGLHLDTTQGKTEETERSDRFWIKFFRNISIWLAILSTITWAGYVFIPSKKDALTIIAGGAVGQFITTDSSAKQIPSEVMLLLRSKIKSEINSLNGTIVADTLAQKSKEELIQMIQQSKKP